VASFDGYLYAINAVTGKELWRFKTCDYGNTASPVLHENVLYQGSRDGVLYALNLQGRELWRFRVKRDIMGIPVIYKNRIYVGACDNNFYCLDLNGREIWRFKTDNYLFVDSLVLNDVVYFGSWDCHFYAVGADSGEELWRFTTSTTIPAYAPPPFEVFETEIKIEKSEDAKEVQESRYLSVRSDDFFGGEYKSKSEYKMESPYKQKISR
jgi:outer membrane protein assembly factor BamB